MAQLSNINGLFVIQKVFALKTCLCITIPVKMRRDMGLLKGDIIGLQYENGKVTLQKMELHAVKYRQGESKRGPADNRVTDPESPIRRRATKQAPTA